MAHPLFIPSLLLLAYVTFVVQAASLRRTSTSVSTPLGTALGVADTSTVTRFAVQYASAGRWQDPSVVTQWELPNGSTDPSELPLACPQPPSDENSSNFAEDCLSMILYVPNSGTSMPTMMWIHGGSFIVGSATGPGLDGSTLAAATNSIVAVIQYRLGVLGFQSPSGEPNLAVKDAISALNFLHAVLPSFRGDTGKITIAGQSSGASMVRALLAAPSAEELFARAILQSDPMDFGFNTPDTFTALNNFFLSDLGCEATNSSCLESASLDDIIGVSGDIMNNSEEVAPASGNFEPMRPVRDGSLITAALDLTEVPFPSISKSILVTNVQDEAGPAIFKGTSFIPENELSTILVQQLDQQRADAIMNATFYAVPPEFASNISAFDARNQLEEIGTDQIWRCANWAFAGEWYSSGGTVYLGDFVVGATYPDNQGVDFCEQAGSVCHEDDIQIVFGTALNQSSAQQAAIKEIQARWGAFLYSGNPNVAGFSLWTPVSGGEVRAFELGNNSGALTLPGGCETGFWGGTVPFDYQLFND